MKFEFTHRSPGNSRLILVFAGWSTGPALYADIRREGWDVAVCHGFTSFTFPDGVLEGYSTVVVYAWSLGVFAASRALAGRHVTAAYALNGTERPCDDSEGIPPAIYEGTLAGLDRRNLTKFRRRMMESGEQMRRVSEMLDAEADIAALQHELRTIADEQARPFATEAPLCWRKVFIAGSDRIIPTEAQLRHWRSHTSRPEIVNLDSPHYYPLSKIVDATLPAPERVGERFRAAFDTYDANAEAQRRTAVRLTGMLSGDYGADSLAGGGAAHPVDVLEIGACSGLFSRMYAPVLRPERITFVDLFEPPHPFGVAPSETYIAADAERWIESVPDCSFDMILSASTIQWFADLERFLHEARRVLRPGGRLLCGSFAKGNLRELDGVRPSPLLYRTRSEVAAMLAGIFPDSEVTEDEFRLEFVSPREALLHLKLTGVAGSGTASAAGIRHLMQALTPADPGGPVTLTFHPLYLTATK